MTTPRLEPTLGILIAGKLSFTHNASQSAVYSPNDLLRDIAAAAADSFEAAPDFYGEAAGARSTIQIIQKSSDTEGHITLHSSVIATQVQNLTDEPIYIDGSQRVTGSNTKTVQLPIPADLPKYEVENLHQLLTNYSISIADIVLCTVDANGSLDNNEKLSALVRKALLLGRPIALMDASARWHLSGHVQLDPYKRKLLSETMQAVDLIDLFFTEFSLERLKEQIMQVMHGEQSGHSNTHSIRHQLQEYFQETAPKGIWSKLSGRVHAVLMSLIQGGHGLFRAMRLKPISSWFGVSLIEALRSDQASELGLREPLTIKSRFEWSDRMANVNAGKYRDVTWLLYLLSACAVFSAVAGGIYLWVERESYFWAYIELLTITAIIAMVAASKRGQWHTKWLFHRSLAEQLRYSRLAHPFILGWVYGRMNGDDRFGYNFSDPDPISWVVHRTFVAEGLPSHADGQRVFEPIRAGILLAPYAKSVIEGQKQYHRKTAHEMHVSGHRLHFATLIMFVMTTIAVLMHFVVHEKWLLIFTAALPAFAAALHGIKVQLEFERLSATSQEMADSLRDTLTANDTLSSSGLDEFRKWMHLRGLVLGACVKLASAADRWNEVVRPRKVDLPG